MDYRSLLLRYIQHVRNCEGIDYLDSDPGDRDMGESIGLFSDEEWAELQQMSEEAEKLSRD